MNPTDRLTSDNPEFGSFLLPGESSPPSFSALPLDASPDFSDDSGEFPSDSLPLEEVCTPWNFVRAFGLRVSAKGWSDKDLFRLARELRWIGVEPTVESMTAAGLRLVCDQFRKAFDRVVDDLAKMWHRVRSSPQDNSLVRAMRMADGCWQEFEVWGVKGPRAKILAVIHYLHVLSPELLFVIIPRARIAEWLGLSDKTTGKLIGQLLLSGHIRLNENAGGKGRGWSYAQKQAREARLVGLAEEVRKESAAAPDSVAAVEPFLNPAPPAVATEPTPVVAECEENGGAPPTPVPWDLPPEPDFDIPEDSGPLPEWTEPPSDHVNDLLPWGYVAPIMSNPQPQF